MAAGDSENYIFSELRSIDESVKDLSEKINSVDKTITEYKISFDSHIKQDELMYEEFKRMNDILQSNTESLKQHMYRTELLETAVLKLDQRLTPLEIEDIKKTAIKDWISKTAVVVAKIGGAIGGVVGLIYSIMTMMGKI